MQDPLAGRLLQRSGMEALDRQTVQTLQKSSGTRTTDNQEGLRAVAKEFEALFLNYMLSVMRETIDESGLTEKGPGASVYTELFDQEIARSLAGRRALGISDLLVRKLSQKVEPVGGGADNGAAPESPATSAPDLQTGAGKEMLDFHMPVSAPVSSSYGIREDPFTHRQRMHRGVDIAAPEGMEVHTACAGVVVFAGYENGYGNTIVVQHPGGFETRYAHLNKLMVGVGDQVQVNGSIGTVGSTGRSTGPHLHFEVIRNGSQVDPEALMPH